MDSENPSTRSENPESINTPKYNLRERNSESINTPKYTLRERNSKPEHYANLAIGSPFSPPPKLSRKSNKKRKLEESALNRTEEAEDQSTPAKKRLCAKSNTSNAKLVSGSDENNVSPKTKTKNRNLCEVCNKEFANAANARRHERTAHSVLQIPRLTVNATTSPESEPGQTTSENSEPTSIQEFNVLAVENLEPITKPCVTYLFENLLSDSTDELDKVQQTLPILEVPLPTATSSLVAELENETFNPFVPVEGEDNADELYVTIQDLLDNYDFGDLDREMEQMYGAYIPSTTSGQPTLEFGTSVDESTAPSADRLVPEEVTGTNELGFDDFISGLKF